MARTKPLPPMVRPSSSRVSPKGQIRKDLGRPQGRCHHWLRGVVLGANSNVAGFLAGRLGRGVSLAQAVFLTLSLLNDVLEELLQRSNSGVQTFHFRVSFRSCIAES
jgi:hypothetical protein